VRTARKRGPKALKKSKTKVNGTTPGKSSLKAAKIKSSEKKPPGETSYIIEEMMDHGIAKGDITMSDGTGTDNMTCIIV